MTYVAFLHRDRRKASKMRPVMMALLALSVVTLCANSSVVGRVGLNYSNAARLSDMQTLAVYAAAYRRGTHIIKAKFKTVVTGDPPDRDHWGVHDFRATFRFKKQDLDRLIAALRLPPKIVSGKRYSCTAETALLLYLYRFLALHCCCIAHLVCSRLSSSKATLLKMEKIFNMKSSKMSSIINHLARRINADFKHVLVDLERWHPYFAAFSEAIDEKTGRCLHCIGFIDGKVWRTARPVRLQRAGYNGHKKHHGIKSQAVTFPNGMIGHFTGPWPGCRHDARMLRESGFLAEFRRVLYTVMGIVGRPYCIYGDPAYPVTPELYAPYRYIHIKVLVAIVLKTFLAQCCVRC
jgi:hypothetical protein